jgi:hypothetical protein
MMFSTVLTRITMMGKVRNMNQSETKKDFFSSFTIMGGLSQYAGDRRMAAGHGAAVV